MFDIEYRSGINKISKGAACIEVVCHNEKSNENLKHTHSVVFRVNHRSIYEDMNVVNAKVDAMTVLWDHVDIVYIVVSSKILKWASHHMEHLLSHICINLGLHAPMLNKQWVLGHAAVEKNFKMEDIVHRIKKVYAGKIMALYPANVATPTMLCTILARAFQEVGAEVLVLDDATLHNYGFGLITGIGDSASNPPKMLVVRRDGSGKGKKHGKRIGIVGKGVTFDSGGLAVKPLRHMHDMKFDKIGAIYGCMTMLYFLERRDYDMHSFVGAFPFVENAISEKALRPGDVIKSFSGKTVEVKNPDAEGRLILADALSYIQKYEPEFLLDIATLTGDASRASCWHAGMFYTHTPSLVSVIKNTTENIGERMLEMPYWQDRKDILISDVADLINSPLKCSDATVAAMFLDEFVDDTLPWVHLDLAHEIDTEMPMGHGIRTAIRIIEHVCKKK